MRVSVSAFYAAIHSSIGLVLSVKSHSSLHAAATSLSCKVVHDNGSTYMG